MEWRVKHMDTTENYLKIKIVITQICWHLSTGSSWYEDDRRKLASHE